jgi:hypothetical protein
MSAVKMHPTFSTARINWLGRAALFINVYEEISTGRIWYGVANDQRMAAFSTRDRLLYRVKVRRRAPRLTTG